MNILELQNIFKDCRLEGDKIFIESNALKFFEFIKNKYSIDMLKEIIATDCKENGIELNYHLYTTEDEEDIYVSIMVKDEAESVTSVYDSAYADEKEIYDLFGVKFIGNDELKRLYMPESWEGHPLKKDYEDNDQRLTWNE